MKVLLLNEAKKIDTKSGELKVSGGFISDVYVNDSVPQKVLSGKKFGGKKQPKVLGNEAKVATVAIKCYDEQLIDDWATTCERIEKVDSAEYQILGIKHDKDEVTHGVWDVAKDKTHYHIIARVVNRKKRFRVKSMMAMLGVQFRKGLDETLWINQGVESVGNFSAYANYLTHETLEAINDGKHVYEEFDIVSNLDVSGIRQVREGYTRIVADDLRVTTADLTALDIEAFELGYNVGNYDTWYRSLPFIIRSNAKIKTIRESYNSGVAKRILDNLPITRLCVFIKGGPNVGKTYAAERALPSSDFLTVRGGGTGKFDKLRPDHQSILIDDDVCPNLLNMTDNYPCFAYKRNSNNPAWTGDHFVVTSNLEFHEWLASSGLSIYKYPNSTYEKNEHYDAMLSRFFVCEIFQDKNGVSRLYLHSPSTRGDKETQKERAKMFADFREKFEATIANYEPNDSQYDYTGMLGFGS